MYHRLTEHHQIPQNWIIIQQKETTTPTLEKVVQRILIDGKFMQLKYRTLTVLLFGILIIPQITFAAWWNPLSWKVFNRTDTKTQILENRVKELENRLENKTATTSSAGTIIKTSAKNNVKAVIKPKSTDPIISTPKLTTKSEQTTQDDTNYSEQVISYLGRLIKEYDDTIYFAKESISWINSIKTKAKNNRDLFAYMRDTSTIANLKEINDSLVKLLDITIDYCERNKVWYENNIQTIEQVQKKLKDTQLGFYSKKIDRQRFLSEFEASKVVVENIDSYNSTLSSNFKVVVAEIEKEQGQLDEIVNLYKIYLSQLKGNLVESRSNPVIPATQLELPKIEFPKTTRCTISGDGGVGLQAYINCSTY